MSGFPWPVLLGVIAASRRGGGAAGYWNPADKSADVTLSGGNKIATVTVGGGLIRGVRGVIGKSTGKHYFEATTEAGFNNGDAGDAYVGVASSATSLSGQPIFSGVGGQYAAIRGNGQYGSDGGFGGVTGGSGWAAVGSGVQVVGLAVDVDALTIDFYDYGGFRATQSFSAPSGGIVYPWTQNAIMSGTGIVLRMAAGEFTLGIPSGYTAWG